MVLVLCRNRGLLFRDYMLGWVEIGICVDCGLSQLLVLVAFTSYVRHGPFNSANQLDKGNNNFRRTLMNKHLLAIRLSCIYYIYSFLVDCGRLRIPRFSTTELVPQRVRSTVAVGVSRP